MNNQGAITNIITALLLLPIIELQITESTANCDQILYWSHYIPMTVHIKRQLVQSFGNCYHFHVG